MNKNTDNKLTAISEEHRTLLKEGAPLSTFFPVKFTNGAVADNLHCSCGNCGKRIDDERTRFEGHTPNPDLLDLRGVGVCRQCSVLTPFRYRVRARAKLFQIEGPSPKGDGSWMVWRLRPARPAFWNIIGWARYLRRYLHAKA
ncbi:hypothetical protein [Thioalkalivibrio thiocyanodenitrificans]|uniref:hypothetical protein n=1 Tax=Thioalkalivibrio thiocyanodenitrificans TaxID=243063 RepID=UPI00035CD280|nr:hypothetical protein [Thioalkalivibrio thiocyanodenitrificans]